MDNAIKLAAETATDAYFENQEPGDVTELLYQTVYAAREAIELVLASKDPQLGITTEQAEQLKAAIIDWDMIDERALTAYDLAADRIVHGRAF
jgi:hypothetical protein